MDAVYASQPPSGGCVLKHAQLTADSTAQKPAAFRRLCVETEAREKGVILAEASRLQAAVC